MRARRGKPAALLVLLTLASACLAACGGSSSGTETGTPRDVRYTLPSTFPSAGRSFVLHAPPDRTTPVPLVIMLSGVYGTPEFTSTVTGLSAFSDSHNFSVAYPESSLGLWNAGSCCSPEKKNDLQFLVDVVGYARRLTAVDQRRVYVWGLSNGGMMAWTAACYKPDVFAAAGVVAGVRVAQCPNPVRLLHLHGTDDDVVPLNGGESSLLKRPLPSVTAEKQGIPAGSDYELKVIPGLGHDWPTATNSPIDANSALWAFSERFTRG